MWTKLVILNVLFPSCAGAVREDPGASVRSPVGIDNTGIEVLPRAVCHMARQRELPAQAQIQGEIRSDFEIVLREEGHVFLARFVGIAPIP